MKKFMFLVLVFVASFVCGLDNAYSEGSVADHGSLKAQLIEEKTGYEVVYTSSKTFYPRQAPLFNVDAHIWPEYFPIFTFRRPAEKHEYNQLAMVLNLSEAQEVRLSSGGIRESRDLKVAALYVQLLEVDYQWWPKGSEIFPRFVYQPYQPIGHQQKLVCQANVCSSFLPARMLAYFLGDKTYLSNEISFKVIGYDLVDEAKGDCQRLYFDPKKENSPEGSHLVFGW